MRRAGGRVKLNAALTAVWDRARGGAVVTVITPMPSRTSRGAMGVAGGCKCSRRPGRAYTARTGERNVCRRHHTDPRAMGEGGRGVGKKGHGLQRGSGGAAEMIRSSEAPGDRRRSQLNVGASDASAPELGLVVGEQLIAPLRGASIQRRQAAHRLSKLVRPGWRQRRAVEPPAPAPTAPALHPRQRRCRRAASWVSGRAR
jgi:hypothetical protein